MIATKTNCLELINNKKWRTLIQLLQEMDAIEVADLVEGYSKTNKIIVFRLLSRQQAKEVFKMLDHSEQGAIDRKSVV